MGDHDDHSSPGHHTESVPGHNGDSELHRYETRPADGRNALADAKKRFRDGEYESTVEAFRQAVLAAPEDGTRKLSFGVALFAAGDYGYAAYAIRRGLDRTRDWQHQAADPKYHYGNPDDFDRHLAALNDHLNTHGTDKAAHFVRGYMLWASGRKEDARAALDEVSRIDPDNAHARKLRELAGTPG